MSVTAKTLHVSPARSDSLSVKIVPIANFRREVELSCAAGLPETYTCNFSPASLAGGGVSILTIQSSSKTAETPPETIFLYAITIGLCSALVLGGCGPRSRAIALLLVCCSLGLLSACSIAPSSGTQTRMIVLTVRATSGSGTTAIVHSTQFSVVIRN